MNKTFAEEWKLYKEGGSRPKFRGEAPRGEAEFDAPVKAGEIRVFADMARPFVALVAEERGVAGWLLVPVSPFTVPASPREALEGERVYQLWNACTAARSFVARRWRVEEVSSDALLSLNETIKQSKQSSNLSLAAMINAGQAESLLAPLSGVQYDSALEQLRTLTGPSSLFFLAGYERILALLLHICLSLILFRGLREKRPGMVVLCYVLHFALDAILVLINRTFGIIPAEAFCTVFVLLVVLLTTRLAPLPPRESETVET